MPVEIREIIIRAYVDETPEAERSTRESELVDREAMVEDCVEQVMEMLKREQER